MAKAITDNKNIEIVKSFLGLSNKLVYKPTNSKVKVHINCYSSEVEHSVVALLNTPVNALAEAAKRLGPKIKATDIAAGAFFTAIIDRNMAEFTCRFAEAEKNMTAGHNSRPDSAVDKQHHIVVAAAHSRLFIIVARKAGGIVLKKCRYVKTSLEICADIGIMPEIKSRRIENSSVLAVKRTGCRYTDTDQLTFVDARFTEHFFYRVRKWIELFTDSEA